MIHHGKQNTQKRNYYLNCKYIYIYILNMQKIFSKKVFKKTNNTKNRKIT